MCRRGFSDLQTALKNVADDRVRAYVIWTPIFPDSDKRDEATARASESADHRVIHLWDGRGLTGDLWQRVLEIEIFAWDVYLLYGADATWEKQPAKPGFWMHQLSVPGKGFLTKAPKFDEQEFEARLREFLSRIRTRR